MSQVSDNQRAIISSVSFMAFAREHGPRVQRAVFTNKKTNATFASLVIFSPSNEDNKTFVGFSSKLGELSAKEVATMKNDLQVVELEGEPDEETGEIKNHFVLCKKGQNNWEDVDLGL